MSCFDVLVMRLIITIEMIIVEAVIRIVMMIMMTMYCLLKYSSSSNYHTKPYHINIKSITNYVIVYIHSSIPIYTYILHHPTCIINSHLYSSNIVQCMDKTKRSTVHDNYLELIDHQVDYRIIHPCCFVSL